MNAYPEVESVGSYMTQHFVVTFRTRQDRIQHLQDQTLHFLSTWQDYVLKEPDGLVFRVFFETDQSKPVLRMFVRLEPVKTPYFESGGLVLLGNYGIRERPYMTRDDLHDKFSQGIYLDKIRSDLSYLVLVINTVTEDFFHHERAEKDLYYFRHNRWQIMKQ
jgi:hypothetical protein